MTAPASSRGGPAVAGGWGSASGWGGGSGWVVSPAGGASLSIVEGGTFGCTTSGCSTVSFGGLVTPRVTDVPVKASFWAGSTFGAGGGGPALATLAGSSAGAVVVFGVLPSVRFDSLARWAGVMRAMLASPPVCVRSGVLLTVGSCPPQCLPAPNVPKVAPASKPCNVCPRIAPASTSPRLPAAISSCCDVYSCAPLVAP